MASFLRKTKEEIGIAAKIGELKPNPWENDFKQQVDFKAPRGQCWHVVFAPDESCFAWICSPNKVLLVPWDRQKNCLVPQKPVAENANESVSSATELKGPIALVCSHPFLCIAFGISHDNVKGNATGVWTLFDFTNTKIVASGHTHGRIRIWNVDTGAFLMELISHQGAIRDLAFAPDGSLRLISASLDKTLKGWDMNEDGNMFKSFIAHKDHVLWCCWSPTSELLASAGKEKTVFIWDMHSYKLVRTLEGHCNSVVSCSFSPDGAVLATASWDTQVILWDPAQGIMLYTLYHLHPRPNLIYASGDNGAWVRGVSYSKNGMNIATISDDHLVRMWNMMGDLDPESIAGEEENPISCAFSPSGRCLAVGTDNFKVTFYQNRVDIPRLTHLSRMAVRKVLKSEHVDTLEIPNCLKLYLKYNVWT